MPRIKLTVPAAVLPTAKLASQAMDPDVGGYYAFEIVEDDGRYSYTVDVTEDYLEALLYLIASPELLAASISNDLSNRFPEQQPPTDQECAEFAANLSITYLELP